MKRYIVTLTPQEQEELREIIAKRSSKAGIFIYALPLTAKFRASLQQVKASPLFLQ